MKNALLNCTNVSIRHIYDETTKRLRRERRTVV